MSSLQEEFHLACQSGDAAAVRKFLADGTVDLHRKKEFPFRVACERGRLDVVEALVDHADATGSPIDIHVKRGRAFTLACRHDNSVVAAFLISRFFHKDSQFKKDVECYMRGTIIARSILNGAAQLGLRDIVDILFSRQDKGGGSPCVAFPLDRRIWDSDLATYIAQRICRSGAPFPADDVTRHCILTGNVRLLHWLFAVHGPALWFELDIQQLQIDFGFGDVPMLRRPELYRTTVLFCETAFGKDIDTILNRDPRWSVSTFVCFFRPVCACFASHAISRAYRSVFAAIDTSRTRMRASRLQFCHT